MRRCPWNCPVALLTPPCSDVHAIRNAGSVSISTMVRVEEWEAVRLASSLRWSGASHSATPPVNATDAELEGMGHGREASRLRGQEARMGAEMARVEFEKRELLDRLDQVTVEPPPVVLYDKVPFDPPPVKLTCSSKTAPF